jgi:starvation-inducible DNA-binding protein
MDTAPLRQLLGDVFLMYTHAHIYHWNITGPDFPDKHSFLGTLYNDLWASVDAIAEHIRAAGELAPRSLAAIYGPATFEDDTPGVMWDAIREDLSTKNRVVMLDIYQAIGSTTDQGLLNFLADRMDRHAKWQWMLDASR